MPECAYRCGQKDIKNLEEHYMIDHASNQGLRDPVAIGNVKVASHEERPDLIEGKKAADEARKESAKKQIHPILQKDSKKIDEIIVTTTKTTGPTVSTAEKVKAEQDDMGTASSVPK